MPYKITYAKKHIFLFNSFLLENKNKYVLARLHLEIANLTAFVGYNTINDNEASKILTEGLEQINSIENLGFPRKTMKLESYKIAGEIHLNLFFILKNEPHFKETIENYDHLFKAKHYFSKLINENNAHSLPLSKEKHLDIFLKYSETVLQLSRYVEPLYFLDFIKNNAISPKYNGSYSIANFALKEAIKENTCNNTHPLLLIDILEFANNALNSKKHIDKRNIKLLEETIKDSDATLSQYCNDFGETIQELKHRYLCNIDKIQEYDDYEQFKLEHHLVLNEHALYCNCKYALDDNLTIKAGCEHTKIDWLKNFEFDLIDMIHTFCESRKNYYDGIKALENYDYSSNDIIQTPAVQKLRNSFKDCFSAFDKIAFDINLAMGKPVKKVFFHTFFDANKVKEIINNTPNNLYLIALFSIAKDFNDAYGKEELHYHKKWRNEIEHNSFRLISPNADIKKLEIEYPDTFLLPLEVFKNVALLTLYHCKSAIFSFAWAMRKLSKIHDSKT